MVGLAVLSIVSGVAGSMARAQTQPFIKHGFEESENGWQTMGTGGKVSRTTESVDVKEGKSALAFDYKVEKGSMGVLILPTPGGEMAKARTIRFWIKADYNTPVVVALQEKEAGRYLSMFTAPVGKWQQVELSPGDFYLSDDANDPKDPDNKLDLDQVESIAVLDVAQMFAQADEMTISLLGIKTGAHRLLLDDFSVSAEPLATPPSTETEFQMETLSRPQMSWFGIGVQTITLAPSEPLKMKSIQVDYRGAPMKPAGFIKRLPRGKLAGMDRLTFTCAAAKPAKLMVQLEEKSGGKYNVMIDIPGGKTPKEQSIKFAELIQSDDSKDSNGKLDLDDVKQILFMDLLAWVEMSERDNTLWIGNLKAVK
jgi:hypothetical protein